MLYLQPKKNRSDFNAEFQYDIQPKLIKYYLDIKFEHPNHIIFIQVGDFFETYFQDALFVAECGIKLTLRRFKNSSVHMCGFPTRSVYVYAEKILLKGCKIILCEQRSVNNKVIVERDVLREFTPGTFCEYTDYSNHRILAASHGAFAYIDFSIGELIVDITDNILAEIKKIQPVEIVSSIGDIRHDSIVNIVSKQSPEVFDRYYGPLPFPDSIKCVVADLLQYVGSIKGLDVFLPRPVWLGLNKTMHISPASMNNLEHLGSKRVKLADQIVSTMTIQGKRLLHEFVQRPCADLNEINHRLNAVQFLVNNRSVLDKILIMLSFVQDMKRLASKIGRGRALKKDLIALKDSIIYGMKIIDYVINLEAIQVVLPKITAHGHILQVLQGAIEHPKLAQKELEIQQLENDVQGMCIFYQTKFNLATLKIDPGMLIELHNIDIDKIPNNFIHRRTEGKVHYFDTMELCNLRNKITIARAELLEIEGWTIRTVYGAVDSDSVLYVYQVADVLAKIDVIASFAKNAINKNYVRPIMEDSGRFEVIGGFYPFVRDPIANDAIIDRQIYLLTGPNMSGKSTYMRQNALIAIMAHIGSFVPAASANIGVIDAMFVRMGLGENVHLNQSTFMSEISEVSDMLKSITNKSFLVVDEIGRGTSNKDAVGIALGCLKYIQKIGSRCIFATHYHELLELTSGAHNLIPMRMRFKLIDHSISFDYKIEPGVADSYGIYVARMANIPEDVIRIAQLYTERAYGAFCMNNLAMCKSSN